MELEIVLKIIAIYLCIGVIWNIILTQQFKIINRKNDEPLHPILVTLFCLYWIITIPILIHSTMKYRKENDDDL